MKRIATTILALACGAIQPAALAATTVLLQRPFTGVDLSGVYTCTGMDEHDGKTAGTLVISLVQKDSHGPYAAYALKFDSAQGVSYTGEGVSMGLHMAKNFVHPEADKKDYGTGIATFSRSSAGKWRFVNFYYEPEYKGGGMGTESCVQR